MFTFHTGQMETSVVRGLISLLMKVHIPHRSDGDIATVIANIVPASGSHSTQVRWRRRDHNRNCSQNSSFTFHTGQMETRITANLSSDELKFTFHTGQMETYIKFQGDGLRDAVHIPHRSDGDASRPDVSN